MIAILTRPMSLVLMAVAIAATPQMAAAQTAKPRPAAAPRQSRSV